MKNTKYTISILLLVVGSILHANAAETNSEIPLGLWISLIVLAMLLLLAFYSKRTGRTEDSISIERVEQNENHTTVPRRIQHYKFAHKILNDIFFDNPDNLIQNYLTSEDGLKSFWYDVGKYYSESFEGAEELDGSGIKITAKEIEDTLFVVISLPEPKDVSEAYFIGLIIPHKHKEKSRYITLELGKKGSILCEWTKESHLNFGEGPEATLENFQNKLITMGDVSAKSWNDSKPIYTGEEWMKTLWKWADSHEVSPLVLPRNSAGLKALEYIFLNFEDVKNISHLPKELGRLLNLQTFIMHYSEIEELPNEFSELTNLEFLYLDGNKLTKLPEGLCKLTKIKKITLSDNNLKSLPDCIGDLQNLVSINLNYNLIEELPKSLSHLKLQELRLIGNPLNSISEKVQSFLNLTRKKDASQVEPFIIVWQECGENSDYAKFFNVPDFAGYLPFFLSGEEVSRLESEGVNLSERHLLLGILDGLNMAGIGSIRLREDDEEVLIDLVYTLSKEYGFKTIEEMVLDASARIRNINGEKASRRILETGHKLVPESSIIMEHLILDIWSEIGLFDSEYNLELLEEIPVLVEKINLSELHPYLKQLICYYGLCALIFISRMKNEEYLENDGVDTYLKNVFYPNVTDKLLLEKAVALMKEPNKYEPIDMMSPIT